MEGESRKVEEVFGDLIAEKNRNVELQRKIEEQRQELHQLRCKLILAESMVDLKEIIIQSYANAWLSSIKATIAKTAGKTGS